MGQVDVSLKHTISAHPRDWAEFLGVRRGVPVEVVDSDVSAVTTVADKVFLVQDFRYEIVRVWRVPAEQILAAGAGMLPLAPIAKVQKRQTPDVVQRMAERMERELPRAEAAELWTATYVLAGLRYDRPFARALLRGVREIMKESTTYQEIVEEGRAGTKQGVLILQGRKRFSREPDERTLAAIREITDLARLDALLVRVLDAEDWDDLFASR